MRRRCIEGYCMPLTGDIRRHCLIRPPGHDPSACPTRIEAQSNTNAPQRDIVRQHLNLSSERIRQIQTEALGKPRRILHADQGFGREGLL